MDHGIDIERRTHRQVLEIAKLMNAPLVATNDAHYVKRDDRKIQDALLCINSGSRINDPDRFKFDGDGYYIRSSDEMRAPVERAARRLRLDPRDRRALRRALHDHEGGRQLHARLPGARG